MKALRLIFAALVCTAPLLAAAQWVYLDKDGRKVFSDKAPPPEVTRILRQPGARPGSSVAVESPAPMAEASATTTAKPSGVDKNLETRKKQAEAEAAGKKKADEEKFALQRSDNCTRARAAKSDFESGVRIVRTNAQGEREVMDDKQREAELRRIDSVIAGDCAKQ